MPIPDDEFRADMKLILNQRLAETGLDAVVAGADVDRVAATQGELRSIFGEVIDGCIDGYIDESDLEGLEDDDE